MIKLNNVTIGYPGQIVKEGIDWEIAAGTGWFLSGSNGSGKSTLLRTIAGKLRHLKGSIDRDMEDPFGSIRMMSFTDASRLFTGPNHVHYYQQRFNSWDSDGHLTVLEYLQSGGFSSSDAFQNEVVDSLGLRKLLNKERIKLSSGQMRKMLIARALLQRPSVLILDNLYIGLDQPSRQFVNGWIDDLYAKLKMTIIISGHPTELPDCIKNKFELDEDHVLSNQFDAGELRNLWSDNRVSHDLAEIVKLRDLNISYGPDTILRNLNWTVERGEKWHVTGGNGSGKSTLISIIYGDNPQAYAHDVFLFGRKRGSGESIWDIKQKMGFTSSELHAFMDSELSAIEVVLTGIFDRFEIMGRIEEEHRQFAFALFGFFGASEFSVVKYRHLSTGYQRLVLFLRALIKKPPVLLLDEPFQGMDHCMMTKARSLIDLLLGEDDTLMFITHFNHECPDCIDQILSL